MGVLIARDNEISEHWNQMVNMFMAVLPESGGQYRLSQSNVNEFNEAELSCQSFPNTVAIRLDGSEVHLVPLLETVTEPPNVWINWHEAWRSPQMGPRQRRRQFHSSSVTVYIGAASETKLQVLRAEWAGAEVDEQNQNNFVFQGNGAAHPHWHLDGISRMHDVYTKHWSRISQDFMARRDLAREVNVSDEALQLFDISDVPSLSEDQWLGPSGPSDMHAENPGSCINVRRWLVSCVHYLQTEIQEQMHKGRLGY